MEDFEQDGAYTQGMDGTESDLVPQQFGASPGSQAPSAALRPQVHYNTQPPVMPIRERQGYPAQRHSIRSEASKGSSYAGDDDEHSRNGGGIFRCFNRCFGRGAEQAVEDSRRLLEDFIEQCFDDNLRQRKAPITDWIPREMDRQFQREAARQGAANHRLETILEEVRRQFAQQAADNPPAAKYSEEELLLEVLESTRSIETRLDKIEERLDSMPTAQGRSKAQRPVNAKVLDDDSDEDDDVERSAALSGRDAKIYNYRQVMEQTRGEAEKFTRGCKEMQGKAGRTLEKMEADLGKLFQLASHNCQQFTQSQNNVLQQYQQLLQRLGQVTNFVETCGKHLEAARADIVTVPRELQGLPLHLNVQKAAAMQQAVSPQVIPAAMQLRDPLHSLREEILREIEGVKVAVQQCLEAKQRMLSIDDLQDLVHGVVQDRRRQGHERHLRFGEGHGQMDMDRSAVNTGQRHKSLPRNGRNFA
mmetsp:Transcript_45825/g.84026  ORF Transcript_45825/g.84026 Transcript_45825/m.84026 type:complete len:475 (-) Transcript_45825:232-1656(-)